MSTTASPSTCEREETQAPKPPNAQIAVVMKRRRSGDGFEGLKGNEGTASPDSRQAYADGRSYFFLQIG
jgi:hypothetical protein